MVVYNIELIATFGYLEHWLYTKIVFFISGYFQPVHIYNLGFFLPLGCLQPLHIYNGALFLTLAFGCRQP